MNQPTRSRSGLGKELLVLAALAFVLLVQPKGLEATDLEPMLALIEWEHPFPAEVSYFRVYFSDAKPDDAQAGTPFEVGLPGDRGRYRWSFDVQPGASLWVAVQAVGPTGLESPLSEWRRYTWQAGGGALGLPGRPVLVEEATRGSK